MAYDKDSITPQILQKVKVYTSDPNFNPEYAQTVSVVGRALCKWVLALQFYAQNMLELR